MRIHLLAFVIGTLVVGCGASPQLRSPTGFVRVDGDPYDLRVTNADGVVLGVRVLPNRPAGDLGFWAGAVDAQLRQRYTAVAAEDVQTPSGLRGRQLRYTFEQNGRLHHYWSTVFVQARRVVLVEAGGDEEYFTPRRAELEAAIASLRL